MRTLSNKSKASEVEAKDPHEVFREVLEATVTVNPDAQLKAAAYMRGIEAAQEAQRSAQKAKDTADTEESFDEACGAALRAREKEKFFRDKLNDIKFTPRMKDEQYETLVNTVDAAMTEAAAEFRADTIKALQILTSAYTKYNQTADEADRALKALDAAANVLQSRHRYRVYQYVGEPDRLVEDPYEWMRHAIRYTENGRAYKLAISGFDADKKINIAAAKAWKIASSITGK